ncbi:MAG: hypothetical protein LBQ00_02890 [Syntrophobacterales bacterium]|jgi:acyl-CoA synthetase (NDP forming)|nr:hypothetical protein [Syntrophobacterales bacterium]
MRKKGILGATIEAGWFSGLGEDRKAGQKILGVSLRLGIKIIRPDCVDTINAKGG